MRATSVVHGRRALPPLSAVADAALFVAVLTLLHYAPSSCEARTWKDVDLLLDQGPFNVLNAYRNVYLSQEDKRYRNTVPPTMSPTYSAMPSPAPTVSRHPTQQPSASPSTSPSSAPTVPLDPYPPNDPPTSPESYYFNYNTSKGARFGPGFPELTPSFNSQDIVITYSNNYWGTVDLPPYPYNTWLEFTDNGWGPWKGVLENHDPLRNQCGTTGLQSPVDLVETGASCDESHEVRTRVRVQLVVVIFVRVGDLCTYERIGRLTLVHTYIVLLVQPGDFRIGGNSVLKYIDHNKLRLKYQRRPCADRNATACAEPDPPMADFPNGWPGETDTLHVDFKIPSEHTIEGERFDAEMQIYNLHVGRRRLAAQAAVIRATETGFNYYFEEALKAFEKQYQYDLQQCQLKQQSSGNRKLKQSSSSTSTGVGTTLAPDTEGSDSTEGPESDRRELQIGVWDPFHPMLLPSIYFWRYDGSLTEPPCGEYVSWFVCDVPMTISTTQLERMKLVLFTHVDANCVKTSTQYDHGVARPVQDRAGRPVWRCKPTDFVADPPGLYGSN